MKLKALNKALKDWCQSANISAFKRIKHIRKQMQLNSDWLQSDPFNDFLHKEAASVKKELNTWLVLEDNQYRWKVKKIGFNWETEIHSSFIPQSKSDNQGITLFNYSMMLVHKYQIFLN